MELVRTRRAGGERRLRALDAAIDVLAERGTDHTRFLDVSALCGVAVSTLQCYFGSREDMLIEALRRAIELEVVAIEETAVLEPDPWLRMVALVTRSLRGTERDRRIMMEFWRAALRDDELRDYCLGLQDRCREPYLQAIADGREQGVFTVEHDPKGIVDVLTAALCGFSHPWSVRDDRTADGFRAVLLSQLRGTLGLPAGTSASEPASNPTPSTALSAR